jgi:hypothetical protein
MLVLRQIYRDLVADATPKSALQTARAAGKTGSVPTYLSNQISNLQAGLARLTGGSTSISV